MDYLQKNKRGLKNYMRIEEIHDGEMSWKLIGQNGPVEAYELYSIELIENDCPFETRKTYMLCISQFLDYAFEAGVFESVTTKKELNKSISNYRKFLSQGALSKNVAVRKLAIALHRENPLAPRSVVVHLSAVTGFLNFSESLAQETLELISVKLNKCIPFEFEPMIEALGKVDFVTEVERRRTRETVVGGVIRGCTNAWKTKTKSLSKGINKNTSMLDDRWEFPLDRIADLIESKVTNRRDKALYCLLAGGGLRMSEALGLKWEYLDLDGRRVYVKDPRNKRKVALDEKDSIRFKGRNISRVFLYYPFNILFFSYLEKYTNSHEYMSTKKHGYLFQKIKGKNKGDPYKLSADSVRFNNFRRVCKKLGIGLRPDNKPFHPHSLRDSYGVFLLNYIIDDKGNSGLDMRVVQLCLGHGDIKSTQVYARKDIILVDKLLSQYEALMSGNSLEVKGIDEIEATRQIKELTLFLEVSEASKKKDNNND